MTVVRSRRAGISAEEASARPLYARVLGLQYLRPTSLLSFVLFEGSIALGVLLALAELAEWWIVAVLPLSIAVMVKLNDIIAGAAVRSGSRTAYPHRAQGRATVPRSSGPPPDAATRSAAKTPPRSSSAAWSSGANAIPPPPANPTPIPATSPATVKPAPHGFPATLQERPAPDGFSATPQGPPAPHGFSATPHREPASQGLSTTPQGSPALYGSGAFFPSRLGMPRAGEPMGVPPADSPLPAEPLPFGESAVGSSAGWADGDSLAAMSESRSGSRARPLPGGSPSRLSNVDSIEPENPGGGFISPEEWARQSGSRRYQ